LGVSQGNNTHLQLLPKQGDHNPVQMTVSYSFKLHQG